MEFLGNVLGGLIVGACFAFLIAGDEFMCSVGTSNVRAYELCTALDDCFVDFDVAKDYLGGLELVEKYCE